MKKVLLLLIAGGIVTGLQAGTEEIKVDRLNIVSSVFDIEQTGFRAQAVALESKISNQMETATDDDVREKLLEAREKIEEAREKYNKATSIQAQGDYEDAREKSLEAREKLDEAREKYNEALEKMNG